MLQNILEAGQKKQRIYLLLADGVRTQIEV